MLSALSVEPSVAKGSWHLFGKTSDREEVRNILISPVPFRVGRRPDVSLSLDSPAVSKVHAELDLINGDLWIRDLGSTNGTYVNGHQLREQLQLQDSDLIQFANVAFRVHKESPVTATATECVDAADQMLFLLQLEKLLNEDVLVPHFQPIVRLADCSLVGYEVLGRSRLYGLQSPKAMFHAAAQVNLEAELSRMLRNEGVRAGMKLPGRPRLFLNTHARELLKPGFDESLRELRIMCPDQDLTLEVHEAAVSDAGSFGRLRKLTRDLDIELAYDDFGAGQSRLVELGQTPPDCLKFDINLIRNINSASEGQRQLLKSLVATAKSLGAVALAEGVETQAEAETCLEIGFETAQGYYFGVPQRAEDLKPVTVAPPRPAAQR